MQSVFESYGSYRKDGDPLTLAKIYREGMRCRFVAALTSELARPLKLLVLAFLILPCIS
jgi:hypothetical protein